VSRTGCLGWVTRFPVTRRYLADANKYTSSTSHSFFFLRPLPVQHLHFPLSSNPSKNQITASLPIDFSCNWENPHRFSSNRSSQALANQRPPRMRFSRPHFGARKAVACRLWNSGFTRHIVTSCRAVLLPRFGGPEVLELRDGVDVPPLKPNEVLVRVRAASVNPLDTRMRAGYGRSVFEPLLPLILGRDVSGEVAAVGTSVHSLNVGQEVFGALHPTAVRGTYTDYAVLSEEELAAKPASITHVEASAIPFAALTAWRALKSTARIAEGQRLLVIGGGGAVGFAAIQLGVAAGCYVTTTCGGNSVARMLESGVEQAVDYTAEDIEVAIKGKFDAVLDTIGVPETERTGINFLKRGGHYMTLQGEAASLTDRYGLLVGLPIATSILLKKQIQYRYSHGIGGEISFSTSSLFIPTSNFHLNHLITVLIILA
ncbi:unnamed protein product, partial [Linum tenue]